MILGLVEVHASWPGHPGLWKNSFSVTVCMSKSCEILFQTIDRTMLDLHLNYKPSLVIAILWYMGIKSL